MTIRCKVTFSVFGVLMTQVIEGSNAEDVRRTAEAIQTNLHRHMRDHVAQAMRIGDAGAGLDSRCFGIETFRKLRIDEA